MAYGYVQAVYDRIWEILEANATWRGVVPVGNRIKITGKVQNPNKPPAKQEKDFNQVKLTLGRFRDRLLTTAEEGATFCDEGANAAHVREELEQVFLMKLVTRGIRLSEMEPLMLLTTQLLRAEPSDLGLPFTASLGEISGSEPQEVETDDTGRVTRVECELSITVTMEFVKGTPAPEA